MNLVPRGQACPRGMALVQLPDETAEALLASFGRQVGLEGDVHRIDDRTPLACQYEWQPSLRDEKLDLQEGCQVTPTFRVDQPFLYSRVNVSQEFRVLMERSVDAPSVGDVPPQQRRHEEEQRP